MFKLGIFRFMALEAIGACGTLAEYPTLLDIAKESSDADIHGYIRVARQYPSLSGLELISGLLETSAANQATYSAGLAIGQKVIDTHPNEVRTVVRKFADANKSLETIAGRVSFKKC